MSSDLAPRPKRTPRRVRERRAYNVAVVGAVSGLGAVVGAVLAIAGVTGFFGWPFLLACVAALCFVLFKRAVS
jgi:MFS family permease